MVAFVAGLGFLLVAPQDGGPPGPSWTSLDEALRPPRFKDLALPSWPPGRPAHELSSADAGALLSRAAGTPGALGLGSPVDRFVLQRSLWAWFDAHARGRTAREVAPAAGSAADLLKALQLTETEAAALPDPYARAVASGAFRPRFDPARPGEPYLPPDLFTRDGPWVCLGSETDVPLSALHASYFGGRSAFLTFVQVPDGRAAAEALVVNLRRHLQAGPDDPVPPLPAGTQVALVERALALTAGGPALTQVVERLEIQVLLHPDRRPPDPNDARAPRYVAFRLDLRRFREGAADALRPLSAGPADQEPFFTIVAAGRGPWDGRVARLNRCASCHLRKHAEAFGFYELMRAGVQVAGGRRILQVSTPEAETARAIRWKTAEEGYTALRSLWK